MSMHYYAKIDGTGAIVGIQSSGAPIQGLDETWVPVDATVTAHTHYVRNGRVRRYKPGQAERRRAPPRAGFDWDATTFAWRDLRPLAQARADKLREINAAFEQAAAALTAGYPRTETLTWGIQQSEALAWLADSAAPTPYLDGLAAARGLPAAEMRTRTAAKVRAFMAASQELVGRRQALEAAVRAAETAAAVERVAWSSPRA